MIFQLRNKTTKLFWIQEGESRLKDTYFGSLYSDSAKLLTAELKVSAHKDPRMSTACILLLEELFKEQNCTTQFQLLEHFSKAFTLGLFPASVWQEHKARRRLCQGGWIRLSRAESSCGLTCTVHRNTAITWPWLLARDRSTSRDRTFVVPSQMDSTCGEEETVEEHEGAFGATAAKKGRVREQRRKAEVKDIRDISRDVWPHKWEGAVEPSSMAVLGSSLSTRNTSCPCLRGLGSAGRQ